MAGPLASPGEDRTPYEGRGGGAGGKLRSRTSTRTAAGSSGLRRSSPAPVSSPYERPSVGRHASAGPRAAALLSRVSASASQGSWLGGGFLSSASRILTNGVSYLFSSFFSSLSAADTSDDAVNIVSTEGEEELKPDILEELNEADGLNFKNEKRFGNGSDADLLEDSQFKEVENFLKQNTLTREQCNRFIDVLKAKVEDSDAVGIEAEMPKSVEHSQRALARIEVVRASSTSHPDSQRWREERQQYRQKKVVGRTYEQVEDDKLSSPRDIAKKYMDNQLSRASGFTLLPRSPPFKDEISLVHKSPLPLAVRSSNMEGIVDEGLSTKKLLPFEGNVLQSINRPCIPYTQLSNNILRQSKNLGTDANPESGSPWTPYQIPRTGGREMLKRRSVVLEDVGTLAVPARRTKIRTSSVASHGFLTSGNVVAPRTSSITTETPVAALTSSSLRSFGGLAVDRDKISNANQFISDNRDEIIGMNMNFIPIRSSRTAQSILETLERMSPSPKGKSLDGELALIGRRPPTRLSPSMLNKKADRMMQTIEFPGPPADSLEATHILRNAPYVEEPFAHPSNLSTQSIKVKQYPEGPGVNIIPAMSLFCNADLCKASGMDLETNSGAIHAPESFSLKVPDVSVSEQSKKGVRTSAYAEELPSKEEGKGRTQALISNANPEKSNVLVPSNAITFSVSLTATTVDNVPVFCAAPTTASAIPTSSFLDPIASVSEVSQNLNSGFTFPLSSLTGPNLDPPPTPKPMPSLLFQADKANTITASASLQQDTNVSSTITAPLFPVSSSLHAGKFDTKKGSLFSAPSTISQAQFGEKPSIDSSNLSATSASFFPQSLAKTQSASATISSAFSSKTLAITGSLSSFASASTFGSSFAAPSFSFGEASPSSSLVFSVEQSFCTSSSSLRSAVPSSSTSSATAISNHSSSATTSVFPTPSIPSIFGSSSTSASSVFAATSTLAAPSSSEKSLLASWQPEILGRAFGQGSNLLSQQSRSSIPVFGDSVSASSLFANGSSSPSALSTATQSSSSFASSSFSFGSTVPTASTSLGPATSSPFSLTNIAPAFSGSSTFPMAVSSVPSFGLESGKSVGNFGQGAGSHSLNVGTTSGTPGSVGFDATPATASFSFDSKAGSSNIATQIPYKTTPFQQVSVFGSANSTLAFGTTPTTSFMSNDSNEQPAMEEDAMADEITPTATSQTSAPPQAAASPFTFGAPGNNASPGHGLFTFGAQPMPAPSPFSTALAQNPFAQPSPPGGLENPFAGGFALGSGGERPGKRIIRGKRPGAKRGK